MGEKALWPTVAIVAALSLMVTVLLAIGIEVVNIIAAFSVVSTVINLMLYGKLQKVESNTNGTVAGLQMMVKDLVEHVKRTAPIDSVDATKK